MESNISIIIATGRTALSNAIDEQCTQRGFDCATVSNLDALNNQLETSASHDAILLDRDIQTSSHTPDALLADCMAATNSGSGVIIFCEDKATKTETLPPGVRYLTSPLRLGDFMHGLADILSNRGAKEYGGPRRIGPYILYPAERILRMESDKNPIKLTDKEVQILLYLHEHGGQAVPREELLQNVWHYNDTVMTRTLETHIYRLRQKIETDPAHAEILRTESGGYSLLTE